MREPPPSLQVLAVNGLPELREGDDLAALLAGQVAEGDVVVVTSKAVAKAEGRVRRAPRAALLASETDRVLARRGPAAIVRTHHGLVLAAAGIDESNTEPGSCVLLPLDPDGSASGLREALARVTGRNVAVVVTDTAGRAWREGQVDLAIGVAGLEPLHDLAGVRDAHGNLLAVTAPAVADELASAAELVSGKLAGRAAALVRGLAHWVLPPGEHGPGAAALVRPEARDMFGLGAREAVRHALLDPTGPDARRGFGAAADAAVLVEALTGVGEVAAVGEVGRDGTALVVRLPEEPRAAGRVEARVEALAGAHGWRAEVGEREVTLTPYA